MMLWTASNTCARCVLLCDCQRSVYGDVASMPLLLLHIFTLLATAEVACIGSGNAGRLLLHLHYFVKTGPPPGHETCPLEDL